MHSGASEALSLEEKLGIHRSLGIDCLTVFGSQRSIILTPLLCVQAGTPGTFFAYSSSIWKPKAPT
jgi:hypothetical protein